MYTPRAAASTAKITEVEAIDISTKGRQYSPFARLLNDKLRSLRHSRLFEGNPVEADLDRVVGVNAGDGLLPDIAPLEERVWQYTKKVGSVGGHSGISSGLLLTGMCVHACRNSNRNM